MLKLFGQTSQPLSISDKLFNTDNIKSINIRAFKWTSSGEITFDGELMFRHGDMDGTHKFKGTSIPDVYNQMLEFCNNL